MTVIRCHAMSDKSKLSNNTVLNNSAGRVLQRLLASNRVKVRRIDNRNETALTEQAHVIKTATDATLALTKADNAKRSDWFDQHKTPTPSPADRAGGAGKSVTQDPPKID